MSTFTITVIRAIAVAATLLQKRAIRHLQRVSKRRLAMSFAAVKSENNIIVSHFSRSERARVLVQTLT